MKIIKRVFLILLGLLFSVTAYASTATLTVEIVGIDDIAPDNLWSYQMNFDITGDNSGISISFNEVNQHQWMVTPDVSVTNWELLSNVTDTEVVVITENNAVDTTTSPIVDGVLFEITYDDSTTSLSLSFFDFLSVTTFEGIDSFNALYDSSTNTITFSTIPIPSSLLLLSGGLCALLGFNRKKR